MRAIRLARLDKTRPVLILTRPAALGALTKVTVAPITSRIRGLHSELAVGPANGLDRDSVVSLDNVQTIPATDLGRHLGYLRPEDEPALSQALRIAYGLT